MSLRKQSSKSPKPLQVLRICRYTLWNSLYNNASTLLGRHSAEYTRYNFYHVTLALGIDSWLCSRVLARDCPTGYCSRYQQHCPSTLYNDRPATSSVFRHSTSTQLAGFILKLLQAPFSFQTAATAPLQSNQWPAIRGRAL
jgi:hypothetical protein